MNEMEQQKRNRRNAKQKELVEKIWNAIISDEAEEVRIVNCGSHWELNGQEIEGVPEVSISPSRMRFMMDNLIKLDKNYEVEVCYL